MGDPIKQAAPPTEEAKRFGRAAGVLSIGVGSAGALTYLYFAFASHLLGEVGYGEVVVLWSAVFITVSTIFRPVEQLLSRAIAEHRAHHEAIRRPLRVAATIQLVIAACFTVAALALRGPLEDGLLSGDAELYWVMVVAVLGYAAAFFVRGLLAGSGRFRTYAALLLLDASARLVFPVAVAVGIASGRSAVAVGIAAAPTVSLLVLAPSLGRLVTATTGDPVNAPPSPAPTPAPARGGQRLIHGSGFAASVLVILLSEQTLMNAGPLLVRASAGIAAAGFIFNVLMVARAPLVLFQAAATSLLPHLTRLRSHGIEGGDQAFRLSVSVTIAAIALFTGLVALVVLVAGPALMQLAFGAAFSYDRAGLLIVTAGMGLYLTAATLNQAALAQGQERRAAACYAACALGFVVFSLLPVLDEFRRVEIGFTAAAGVLGALLYLLYRQPHRRLDEIPLPGSAEELELELAAGDRMS